MKNEPLRIGALARSTGLTVRTLHHYEDVGLLAPSARTESGYRLYGAEAAERLYAIVALRQLGLSLGEIGRGLQGDAGTIAAVIARHLSAIEARIAADTKLRRRLQQVQVKIAASREPDMTTLVALVRFTTMKLETRHLGEDPAALRVLANAANQALLDRLFLAGPATVAALAEAGELEPTAVAERLAELAEHGFVERLDNDRWSAVTEDLRLPQPSGAEAADATAVLQWVFGNSLRALQTFAERGDDPWFDAATLSHSVLHMTEDELRRFGEEYRELVERYLRADADQPEGTRPATAMLFAFPLES